MAILNTAVVETVIQNKINQLSTSSAVTDLVLPVAVSNLDIGLSSSVATQDDLPNPFTGEVPDGHVVFVQSIGMHVVASQGQWLTFDGRVFKDYSGITVSPWVLWAWGRNIYGQLGNNSVADRSSPVNAAGGFTDWCQVAVGDNHTSAIRSTGTLWTWGSNNVGQLGNNSAILVRSSPTSVVGGFTDWCQVSASNHTAAIRANGTLWAWGCNYFGRLGDNTTVNKSSPVQIISQFQVSAGGTHTAAIIDGAIWAWGSNGSGQLGNNSTISRSSPVSVVGGFTNWCQVSAGSTHTIGLRTNGTIWAWGNNGNAQLGDNSTAVKSSPVIVVGGITDWCQIVAGGSHSAAIRTNGSLWTWGRGAEGQLGDRSITGKSSPVSVVGGFTNWCQVAIYGTHTVALRTDGRLWAWGDNTCGQLGDNTAVNKSSPVSVVGGFADWCQVSAGGGHTAAVRTNGSIWSWGSNGSGQLGNNSTISRSSPVSVVGGFTNWCQVSAGSTHTIGLRTNGTIWAWGNNGNAQLGDNSIAVKSSPVSVVGGITDWCQISASLAHNTAIRSDGSIWTWGRGAEGQLGDRSITGKSSPVSVVGGFANWCQVSASPGHTVAVRPNGGLSTWGWNGQGQLGDNTTISKLSPVAVVGGFIDWCQASAAENNTAAVRTNGTLWTWGFNSFGQLGNNTTINRSSPVSVLGGFTDWRQVSAGKNHMAAVRTNGTLWAWGNGAIGRLGNNTTVNKSSPVQVVGGFTDWCQVAVGYAGNIALRTNGTLWAWGFNALGQLGDNTTVNKSSPVSVVGGLGNWCQVSAGRCHTAAVRTV